jgi:hypothetical protein
MLYQIIVKIKKIVLGPLYGGAGAGTTSPNERCCVGASTDDYLEDAGEDALNYHHRFTVLNLAHLVPT